LVSPRLFFCQIRQRRLVGVKLLSTTRGKKVPIVDLVTDLVREAEIFVGVGLETGRKNRMLIHLSAATITGSLTSAGPPAPTYNPAFYTDVAVRTDPFESAKSHFFDTSTWGAFCDVTLTLKQTRQSDSGGWVKIDDYRCRQAFRHFMSLLNRAVYGAAFRRHGKRLRVLPVLERGEVHARALRSWERGTSGRWHIHCAIELPSHCDAVAVERLIRNCWAKVEWSSGRILVRDGANTGWINYMLKNRQKSDFDDFLDCIIIESVHNPIADA
jgi:hypothetical protein